MTTYAATQTAAASHFQGTSITTSTGTATRTARISEQAAERDEADRDRVAGGQLLELLFGKRDLERDQPSAHR